MYMRVPTAVMASAWLVAAQSPPDNTSQQTLAAFAFVRTGERTPLLRNDTQVLTALGAQQMYALGENFRTRYIAGDSPQRLGVERVAGLSVDTIDNDQIWVQTLDKPYLVSSAQAFMQGLYPPHISNGTGKAARSLADGSRVDYPLNGYQYASIQAASEEDPNSRYVSGAQNCPMAQVAALDHLTTEEFKETEAANADLFKKLNLEWLEGTLPESYFNARSALEIADYMSYQYTHNASIHEALSANDSDYTAIYNRLGYVADEVAWHLYANASDDSTASNHQVIGGKTLAGSILDSFRLQVASRSSSEDTKNPSHALTLYFGEEDAMMGLASLLKLDANSSQFKSIPSYGSAMLFELFRDTTTSADQLWVRFSFHNATADPLTAYPLSPTHASELEIPWTRLETLFDTIAMDSIADWCSTCNSASLFCHGAASRDAQPSLNPPFFPLHSRLSPAIGGLIGASATLFIAALCFTLAMLFGRVRFHRTQRRDDNPPSSLGSGGGAAKFGSNTHLGFEHDAKRGYEMDWGGGQEIKGSKHMG